MTTVLRGPADADHYRVKVGRYGDRFYTDPLPACDIAPASDDWHGPSVSTTKPPFANKYVPIRAIADMPNTEWERLAKLDADARYEAIKTHEKVASRVNMDRGTIVHLWAEDLLNGRPLADPIGYSTSANEQAAKFRRSLEAFFATHQPTLRYAEVVCLNRTLNGVGYGGTADAFVEIDGELWAVDWKSRNSDHDAYPDEAGQGGAYIGAEYMIVTGPDGQPARAPIPKFAGVLIVSIREDGFRAYPIDADGAITHYQSMHAWWVAQQSLTANKVIGRPWAPKATTQADAPTSDVDNLRSRIAALLAAGHENDMRIAWPEGCPTLSAGGHTAAQLVALDEAVARVEARHEMPFQPGPTITESAPQAPIQAPPTEPTVEIDNGGPVDEPALEALRKRVGALPADAAATLSAVTQEAATAGRSLSVKLNPNVRVWEIARALVLWAEAGADLAVLELHVAETATAEQCAEPTTGAALSLFTIAQARDLAEALQRATTAATAA